MGEDTNWGLIRSHREEEGKERGEERTGERRDEGRGVSLNTRVRDVDASLPLNLPAISNLSPLMFYFWKAF